MHLIRSHPIIRIIPSPGRYPHISVIVATCNRPDDIERCLHSLCSVRYPRWDVLIIDQSDGKETVTIAQSYSGRLPSLRHIHSPVKGLSRARNIGLNKAQGDLAAFLDDDCVVGEDWLDRVADVFNRYPAAALVFGAVKAAPHNPALCFIPAIEIPRERVVRGRLPFVGIKGMGASMYLRLALCRPIGPFDVNLGAGSELFGSTEESDYVYRLLRDGQTIVETPAISVEHHGARDYHSGAFLRIGRSYAYATGGLDMKVVRLGDSAGLLIIMARLWTYLSLVNWSNLARGRRPTHLIWSAMYGRGLLASFRLRIDRQQCLYIRRTLPDRC